MNAQNIDSNLASRGAFAPLVDLYSWACINAEQLTPVHILATSSTPSKDQTWEQFALEYSDNGFSELKINSHQHEHVLGLVQSKYRQSLLWTGGFLEKKDPPRQLKPRRRSISATFGEPSKLSSLPDCAAVTQPATSSDDDGNGGNAPLNVSVHCASAGLTDVPYPLPPTTQYL